MEKHQKKNMLIVDDIQLNRLILAELFSHDYHVIEAENGIAALDAINRYGDTLSVILLDLVMPIMDGFGVLEHLTESKQMESIPVILITGEHDEEKVLQGYAMGVADLIKKPFNPDIVARRVSNVVKLFASKQELEQKLREQKEMLEFQSERLRQSNLFVIDALSTAVEYRSLESGEHVKRVRLLTKALVKAMADHYPMDEASIESLSNAATLHDIGKIAIPDAILLKPGPLTREEFEIMKTHTIQGCLILESLNYMQDQEYYQYCYDICRHHHERWDGSGYPDGLKGDEIPIWAQATSLADVYDALTSDRVYKAAYSHEKAISMILGGECGVFNPRLIDAFSSISERLHTLIQVRDHGLIIDPNPVP